MIPRLFATMLLALGSCACSIDDRQLLLASVDGGMAGAFAVEEPDAGKGGEGGDSGGLVGGCADLDTDGVADCESTLVETPTFTDDVRGWTPLGDARLTWDPKNALTDLPSGSAKLSAETRRGSAFQCVSLSGKQLVIAYASAFVERSGDDDDPSLAALEVSFFASEDCSGDSETYFETPPSTVMGAWTTIQAGGLSDETTGSVLIELVGIKAASASEFDAYFDNVMLKAKRP